MIRPSARIRIRIRPSRAASWCWRTVLLLAAPTWTTPGNAQSALTLAPGAFETDCGSVLRLGPSACAGPVRARESERARGIEALVDEALANHGKPPREAMRALLDPSERNIAQWARQQQRTLALATYASARLTAQQQGVQATKPGDTVALAALGQAPVRAALVAASLRAHVTLALAPGLAQAPAAWAALDTWARQLPALRIEVEFTTAPDPDQLAAVPVSLALSLRSVGTGEAGEAVPDPRAPLRLRIRADDAPTTVQFDATSLEVATIGSALLRWCHADPDCRASSARLAPARETWARFPAGAGSVQ